MAEGARLESVFRGNSNLGSNPSLSAITFTINYLERIPRSVLLCVGVCRHPNDGADSIFQGRCVFTASSAEQDADPRLYHDSRRERERSCSSTAGGYCMHSSPAALLSEKLQQGPVELRGFLDFRGVAAILN